MYMSGSGSILRAEMISNPTDLPYEIDGSFHVSPSGLAHWRPILEQLGVPFREMENIERKAQLAGVPFQIELQSSGIVREEALFQALAAHLGLPFDAEIAPESLFLPEGKGLEALRLPYGTGPVIALKDRGRTTYLVAPERLDISAMQRFLKQHNDIASCIRIVPPTVLRNALRYRAKESLARMAVNGLFEAMPEFSARNVLNAWQGFALGSVGAILVMLVVLAPSSALIGLHLLLSVLFLACVLLRVAVSQEARQPSPPTSLTAMRPDEMPVYTVLVALYREAEVVPDLLVALGRLVWPRSKLEIKLVCESDDHETLAAIRAQQLRSYIEVIEVPPCGPRTKPKALSFALPLATGEFVVLFDAEDRPHPFQLVEAWERFRSESDDLACLQAPLVITNKGESWIASMFAFEYAALFRGILPWLAKRGLVLPLGGTSNHFRRAVLERVGGWDPCNVTEDADLGLRLARMGYKTGTISLPTYEDAPATARIWLPQRTRWFKGWMQTWLVHMRDVPRLYRELGRTSFLITQILTLGMWISALAYIGFPISAGTMLTIMAIQGDFLSHYTALLALDIVNVVFGHGAFLALGWRALPKTEQQGLWWHMLCIPFYWLLLSAAAWRALWQLYRCPHAWEKTPHRPSRWKTREVQRRKPGPNPTMVGSSSPIASSSRPA